MGDVLRVPMMRRLWYAQIISVFGDFLALFAVINVITFKLHANAQQVTGVQIAYMLPIAVLGILAGVFVDRWPLKPTMVSSDSIRACLCLLLIFATQIWHFYAILAAISVISSFFGPAQGVAIRSAVPLHGLRSANALMQQVMFGMRIIGPAIAGLMVSYLGAVSCYAFDSASFVGSALLIASVTFMAPGPKAATPTPDSTEASAIGKVWLDMKQGINFIIHHAALLFVILAMAAGMFVLGCFGPLIAIYVRDSLHASTKSFAIASAMIGLGMLIGINGLNTFGKKLKDTAPRLLRPLRHRRRSRHPHRPATPLVDNPRQPHHRLLRRRHHRPLANPLPESHPTRADGPRRFHLHVHHLHRPDLRPRPLRHPHPIHRRPSGLRPLRRDARHPHGRRQRSGWNQSPQPRSLPDLTFRQVQLAKVPFDLYRNQFWNLRPRSVETNSANLRGPKAAADKSREC